MFVNQMSPFGRIALFACLYLSISIVLFGKNRDVANDSSADYLVNAATSSFSDLKVLCTSKRDLCTTAAGFATEVGATASRIYDWAIHAGMTPQQNLQDDQA